MKTSAKPKKAETTQRKVSAKRATARVAQAGSGKRKTAAKRSRSAAPTARREAGVRSARRATGAAQPPLYYRLHALLHTVQTIARYEDQLASLVHEAGHAKTLDASTREELHDLLLDMPSSSYHAELDALHEALHSLSEHGLSGAVQRPGAAGSARLRR